MVREKTSLRQKDFSGIIWFLDMCLRQTDFPLLTVEENLSVAISAAGLDQQSIPKSVYDTFPVLYDMRRRRGGDLSGGQQQQLAIGRALTHTTENSYS